MKTLLYMAALTGLFTLPGCLKIDPAGPADTIKYPTTQGDYWVYKVTNYQKNTVDTVTVTVGGSIKASIAPGNLTVLQLKWPDKIDSQFVSIVNDTLAFYTRAFIVPEDQIAYQMNNFIIYPLPMEERYSSILMPQPYISGHYSTDTAIMVASPNVEVNINNGTHEFTAFHEEKTFLLATWGPMPEFLIFTDDFVPGLGIIKETLTGRTGYANIKGTTSGLIDTWQLLNCHLTNLPSSGTVNP